MAAVTFSSKAIVACVAMIMLGIGVVSFRGAVKEERDLGWVAHTHLVLEKLQAVLIDIGQAEAGERGYLLTGKDWYVGEYDADLNQVGQDLKELRDLTSDNPRQQEAIQRLMPIVEARLAELSEGIKVQKQTGAAAQLEGRVGADGGGFMGGIRVQIGEMRSTEGQLLVDRLETARTGTEKLEAVIVVANVLAIIILFCWWRVL